MRLKTLQTLYEQAKFQAVLDQLVQMEIQDEFASLSDDEQVRCLSYKSWSLFMLGRPEETLRVVITARKQAISPNNKILSLNLQVIQVGALWRLGRLDEALEAATEGGILLTGLTTKERITAVALEANLLKFQGSCYRRKGEYDRALTCYQQGLALREKISNKNIIAEILNNIGMLYRFQGEFERALKYLNQALTLWEETGSKLGKAYALNNIGEIYQSKGELTRSLKYFEQSLAVKEVLSDKYGIAWTLDNIGKIYHQKGELNRSLEYLQKSLTLKEEIGATFDVPNTLFYLISVAIDHKSLEQAQMYLEHLQQINEGEMNKVLNQYCQVAEALLLRTSKRSTNRAKAEELLRQVVEDGLLMHDLSVVALICLCDLLIFEAKTSGEREVWDEAKALTER
ncbi:MAG: tetratricopeptide repeat protein, partial [Candidatus Hodarchaeota archaeon]